MLSLISTEPVGLIVKDLMSRVASEQPEDPVSFLITALRAKQTKKKVKILKLLSLSLFCVHGLVPVP